MPTATATTGKVTDQPARAAEPRRAHRGGRPRACWRRSVDAVGSVAFNERDQAVVQARATGFVERLHVRATLDRVRKGQPLAELYVPDWVAAQEEFLAVRRMQGTDLAPLVDGARQRMRLAGMSDAQIALVERSGKSQPRITLHAPIGGVVAELAVREGMTVMPGATLFRINGLAHRVGERRSAGEPGRAAAPGARSARRARPALPGETLQGQGAGDPARGERGDAHAEGARRARQSRRRS